MGSMTIVRKVIFPLVLAAAAVSASKEAVINLANYGPLAEVTTVQYSDAAFAAASTTVTIPLKTLSGESHKLSGLQISPRTSFVGTGITSVGCTIGTGTAGNEEVYLGSSLEVSLIHVGRGFPMSGLVNGYDLIPPDTSPLVDLYCTAYGKGDEMAPHDLTAYDSHSPFVVTSDTTFGTPAWAAAGAFDDSTNDVYLLGDIGSHLWLKIDIGDGNTKILNSYDIKASATGDASARAPKDWTVLGSNDDSEWATLATVSDETGWSASEKRSYTCDVFDTAYRYFKLNVIVNNGDAASVEIGEWYLQEKAAVNFGNGAATNLTAGKAWVRMTTTLLPDGT